MQLKDITKTLDQMTDEELLERLRVTRQNRTVVRPAYRDHVERAERKVSSARVKKTSSLLDNLTDAERAELIRQLSEDV